MVVACGGIMFLPGLLRKITVVDVPASSWLLRLNNVEIHDPSSAEGSLAPPHRLGSIASS
jgi:hypothetical protein